MYRYESPRKGSVDISRLVNEIRQIKPLEKNVAINYTKKVEIYNSKRKKTYRTIKT